MEAKITRRRKVCVSRRAAWDDDVVQPPAGIVIHGNGLCVGPCDERQLFVKVVGEQRSVGAGACDHGWGVVGFQIHRCVVERMHRSARWRDRRHVAIGIVGKIDFAQVGQYLFRHSSG